MEKEYNKWGHHRGKESITFTKTKLMKIFLNNSLQGVIVIVPGSVPLLVFYQLAGGRGTCLHREFVQLQEL